MTNYERLNLIMKYEQNFNFSDSVVALLRDLIEERMGINYDVGGSEMLSEKLFSCAVDQGFDSLLDYYYFLKYDGSPDAWKQVMDSLTVPETYFWREMDQIRTVVDVLVPQYFSASHKQPLRIWSAACASGEEPLSIAMALNEKGWFYRVPIEIYASDVSYKSLEKAKMGLYGPRSFRNLPLSLQEKYFSHNEPDSSESSFLDDNSKKCHFFETRPNNTVWKVSGELHRRIQWHQANLMDESKIQLLAGSSIIFCRNVFIYFSQKSIRRTLDIFAEYMPSPGYLCVAASESLVTLTTKFSLEEIGGSFIYVKS